jgi:hypothetical protein
MREGAHTESVYVLVSPFAAAYAAPERSLDCLFPIRPTLPTPDHYNSTRRFITDIQIGETCHLRREEATLPMSEMILEPISLFVTLVAVGSGAFERFAETRRGLCGWWWTGVNDTRSRDDRRLVDEECVCRRDDCELFLLRC